MTIDCSKCKLPGSCCRFGAEVDLEEAKKITELGLYGEFFHLELNDSFPSGFTLHTSINEDICTFLCQDGLCSIHKVDFNLKPTICKSFPKSTEKLHYQLCCQLKQIKKHKDKF